MKKYTLIIRLFLIVMLLSTVYANVFAGNPKLKWAVHWYCPDIDDEFEEYIFYVAPGSSFDDIFGFYFIECKAWNGSLKVMLKSNIIISLNQSKFDKVIPNKIYYVKISVNVPENTPLGWYNGTIQFRLSSGGCLPKQLKVSILVLEGSGYSIFRKHAGRLITITDEFGPLKSSF